MSPCILVYRAQPESAIPAANARHPDILPQSSINVSGVSSWTSALVVLRDKEPVTFGTPQELSEYQAFVTSCIQQAASLAACDKAWSDCVDCLLVPLARALELVKAGRTSSGRALAVELIGYAQLARFAEQLKFGGGNALSSPGKPASSCGVEPASSSSSSSSSSMSSSSLTKFKVPALPTKRQRTPGSEEQQQVACMEAQPVTEPQSQLLLQQQQAGRRHSAPKRRATPQVWPGGPICITPSAPPDSTMHGEACCDETLLAYWCPISGKRLKCDPQPDLAAAAGSQQDSHTKQLQCQEEPQRQHVQEQPVPMGSARPSTAPQHRGPKSSAGPAMHASTNGASSSSMQAMPAQTSPAPAAPAAPLSRAAVSSYRSDAIEALKRSMHDDPASKPAADSLLFNKATQLPIVNWTGAIKHKAQGRVVEVCALTLQVPEVYLEEFPGALYAAEIRHRKSVSLGRHVVCRASLQSLSEHQLAGLAAMARSQLVALCMLQTAELHLVPYFDNKNHVRCVGFLKVKAN